MRKIEKEDLNQWLIDAYCPIYEQSDSCYFSQNRDVYFGDHPSSRLKAWVDELDDYISELEEAVAMAKMLKESLNDE